ncbi:CRISPR locus-related DNA-binding protein [Metallosphaera tengchongensis]|uniref:CRISPR locus-related DNA-binding protein n=1 Tax=Metallosphaera tengchongensis TaxID=1532350 RepID=A0A6N0NY21_9CREN|nr:CRISPR locus-related DNA-binding protein [Metallosphaera tengchongensis]
MGFDEKFLVRAFWRRGNKEIKEVLLIKPSDRNEKSEKALNSFSELLKQVEVPLNVLEVDPKDFTSAVSKIARELMNSRSTSFIINLSSGMRILGLEVLTAFLLLDINAELEVEMENQEGVVTWSLKDMVKGRIDVKGDVEILKAVKKGINTVSEVAREVGAPIATVWRKVNRLIEEGYLEKDEKDLLRLTVKGRISTEIYDASS